MGTLKQLDSYKKEDVYKNYKRIVACYKDYDSISLEDMFREIYRSYEKRNLLDIIEYSEFLILKDALEGRANLDNCKEIIFINSLVEKYLISFDDKGNIVVLDEAKKAVKSVLKYLKGIKLKEFQDKSGMVSVLIVLLKIYGYLNYEELKELFYYYTDRDYNIDLLISSRLFKFNSVMKDNYYVYYEYLSFEEDLKNCMKENKLSLFKIDTNTLLGSKYQVINGDRNSVRKLNSIIQENFGGNLEVLSLIRYYSLFDYKRKDLFKELEKYYKGNDFKQDKRLIDDLMNYFIAISLRGRAPIDCEKEKFDAKYNSYYLEKYQAMKDNKDIILYRRVKEIIRDFIDECMKETKGLEEKIGEFMQLALKNKIMIDVDDVEIVVNLALFHRIDSSKKSIFEDYYDCMNAFGSSYNIAYQIENNYVESLFQITGLDSNRGIIDVVDVYSNEKYSFYDIAFSLGESSLVGKHIYTTILEVNNIRVVNEYILLLIKDTVNIKEEVEKVSLDIVGTDDLLTKRFLACLKLYKETNDIKMLKKKIN